ARSSGCEATSACAPPIRTSGARSRGEEGTIRMSLRDRESRRRCVAALTEALLSLGVAGTAVGPAFAQEAVPAARKAPAPTRVIVKFRDTVSARSESQTASVGESATADSGAAGTRADMLRRIAARSR